MNLLRTIGATVAALALAVATLGAAAPARTPAPRPIVVVAPGGSDTAAGTIEQPLARLQTAVDRLPSSGGTVLLRGGVYHQRVSLNGVRDVTIRPYRHEHVTLSGAGLVPPRGESAMVRIEDSSRVTVAGLEITGYRTKDIRAVPIGILVRGGGSDVRILRNHVHHLGNDNGTPESFDIDAHGIAVYGDDPHRSITRLRIAGNEVDHLKLGASESVVVNGNVDGWSITRNRVADNNNIGIDAIGFEPTLPGKYRYSERNRARNGLIAHNRVSGIRSKGNPSYKEGDGWCNCADGIYVDGGTRIRVVDNTVSGNDIGIEVAAENARGSASHVVVARNRITGSLFTGIATGGYCNGAEGCGGVKTGSAHDNVFKDNVLRGNNRLDDGSPEVLVQYNTHDTRFVRNSITATNRAHAVLGTVEGDRAGARNVSDRNWFAAVGSSASQAVFGRGRGPTPDPTPTAPRRGRIGSRGSSADAEGRLARRQRRHGSGWGYRAGMSEGGLAAGVGPSRRAVVTGGALLAALAAAGGGLFAVARTGSTIGEAVLGAAPPVPPFIGAPVPGVELRPAALSTLQSFVALPETGEWFTAQARPGTSGLVDPAGLAVGDIVVSRLSADGALLDSMSLPDSGHGMSLIVRIEAGVRVVYSCWFAPDASGRLFDIVRIPYTPGIAARAAATAVVAGLGYPLDAHLDVTTDAVTLRHQGGGGPQYTRHDWSDFAAGNLSRPTGLIATADWPPTHQGFCSLGDRFFFYTGAASDKPNGDPMLITEYSWASGEVVRPSIDASANSRQPDGAYPGGRMEPEGATVVTDPNGVPFLLVGVANGSAADSTVPRSYRTFRYPLVDG